jgi:hypothetical protein
MLTGYCRFTYSLAVIMLETTQSINNFLPMLLAIGVSLCVSRVINRSLYEYAIRAKQMPLLRNHVPKANANMYVKDIISKNPLGVQVVESVCTVERLAEVIQGDFNSIPVVNMSGKTIGIIPKNFVIVLIENHWWYEEERVSKRIEVASFYHTAVVRQTSIGGSQSALSPRVSDRFTSNRFSPNKTGDEEISPDNSHE